MKSRSKKRFFELQSRPWIGIRGENRDSGDPCFGKKSRPFGAFALLPPPPGADLSRWREAVKKLKYIPLTLPSPARGEG